MYGESTVLLQITIREYNFCNILIDLIYFLFRFELGGDSSGSEGAEPNFLGRVLLTNGNLSENQFYDLEMSSSQNGSLTIEVPDGETQILFAVISVPEYFKGHQTYGYKVNITASNLPTTTTTTTTTWL